MKVPYDEGVASHIGPESCACSRKAVGEVLTGGSVGRVLSRERSYTRVPTASCSTEGNTGYVVIARCILALRGHRPRARTEASRMGTGRSHIWPWQMAAKVRAVNPKGARQR